MSTTTTSTQTKSVTTSANAPERVSAGKVAAREFHKDPIGKGQELLSSASDAASNAASAIISAATPSDEVATSADPIDPLTGKPKSAQSTSTSSGPDWRNLLGGGLFAMLGYFAGGMFGAGPFGMIASIALAVGGFFIGNQNKLGDKIAGFLGFGKSDNKGALGQSLQPSLTAPQQTYGQAYLGTAQQTPYAYPTGMSPEQATYLAQQSGYVRPQNVYYNQGAYIPSDSNRFAPPLLPTVVGMNTNAHTGP